METFIIDKGYTGWLNNKAIFSGLAVNLATEIDAVIPPAV
jgi:hypothetical protein